MVAKPSNLQSPNEGYRFKKPRSVNWVSLLLLVAGAFVIYLAFQFGPVYWKRYKVDRVLQESANVASDVSMLNSNDQQKVSNRVLADTTNSIVSLGINTVPVDKGGNGLQVFFDQGFRNIHAKYTVVIKHPGGKRTTLKFDRHEKVPTRMKF